MGAGYLRMALSVEICYEVCGWPKPRAKNEQPRLYILSKKDDKQVFFIFLENSDFTNHVFLN